MLSMFYSIVSYINRWPVYTERLIFFFFFQNTFHFSDFCILVCHTFIQRNRILKTFIYVRLQAALKAPTGFNRMSSEFVLRIAMKRNYQHTPIVELRMTNFCETFLDGVCFEYFHHKSANSLVRCNKRKHICFSSIKF